jgi:hypothetical protein
MGQNNVPIYITCDIRYVCCGCIQSCGVRIRRNFGGVGVGRNFGAVGVGRNFGGVGVGKNVLTVILTLV